MDVEKITNLKFIDYFEKEFRKLDEVYEEHNNLVYLIEKKTKTKINNLEAHNIGSVVFNLEHGLHQYADTLVYKFVDLINSFISSINSRSFSGAIVVSRALYEHFAMFALKTLEHKKYLNEKNYLKLSRELAYWGVSSHDSEIAVKYKRTHIMDAIRYLNEYFRSDLEQNPNLGENFYEDLYNQLSNSTHPASNSLLMYAKKIDEKWNSSGYKAEMIYSFDVDNQYLYNIGYIFNLISNYLVSDLFPKYIDKVLKNFDENRDYIVKFFTLNPNHAKEILDLTINKEKIDKKREEMGLQDIDKLRFENINKKKV